MNTFTVWACDHLWARYDAKDMAVMSEIHSMCHSQATDSFHNTGLVIPICGVCEAQREHVVVSCRELPHPFDDDAWAEVDEYEEQQWQEEQKKKPAPSG